MACCTDDAGTPDGKRLGSMSTEEMIDYIPNLTLDEPGQYRDENQNDLSDILMQDPSKRTGKRVEFCITRYHNPSAYYSDEYDKYGYNPIGEKLPEYGLLGYNRRGFDREGYNLFEVNRHGFTRLDYRPEGYNRLGRDFEGYDRSGLNILGLTRDHYDVDGYDAYGFDCYGFDRDGLNLYGLRAVDYDENGLDKFGYNCLGYYKAGPGVKISSTPNSMTVVRVKAAEALARAQINVARKRKLKETLRRL